MKRFFARFLHQANPTTKILSLLLFIFVSISLVGFILLKPLNTVTAGSSDNIQGYAWSSNIGWVSFNCTNDSSCGFSNYGVTRTGNNLTGYAWSSNIGWVQFGGLSGFPTGGGTQAVNAQVQGSNLVGWAKVVGAGGGWDGWIALSGTSFGVTLSGVNYIGYAWGGDVVGWLSFDAAGVNGVRSTGGVTLDAQIAASSIVNTTIPYGSDVNIVWTMTPPAADTCQIAKTSVGGSNFNTITGIVASGNTNTGGLLSGGYTFTMTCGSLPSQAVSFTVDAQPAGFSLGATENIRIQFPTNGSADSELKTVTINPTGGFTADVTLSVDGINPSLPGGTTILYSFNGGSSFTASPTRTIPYNSSADFRIRISAPVTGSYTVTIRGTSGGVSDSTKQYIVSPSTINPTFEEF